MATYEELLQEASSNNIEVVEFMLHGNNKGIYSDNCIVIKQDMPMTEKTGTIAEELGHYYTTAGNILDLSGIRNRKQEQQARLWAYDKQVGLMGIVQAYEHRCQSLEEMADYLNVTEKFLREALKCYRSKYSPYVKIDNYIIQFEPSLQVMKLLNNEK